MSRATLPLARVSEIERQSAELYEVLVMITEGEAKLMVRACDSGDGIQAFSRLSKHYNKRTIARMLRLHREVMHPKQVPMDGLIAAIMEWEEKWRRMETEMIEKGKI